MVTLVVLGFAVYIHLVATVADRQIAEADQEEFDQVVVEVIRATV